MYFLHICAVLLLASVLTESDAAPGQDVLTEEQKEMISQQTGCAYQNLPKVCDSSPYRTITGECNNRKNPNLGASNTALKRHLPAKYEDDVSLPQGWTQSRLINGFTLPSVLEVSNEVGKFPTSITMDNYRYISHMVPQFGQFIDHDVTRTPDAAAKSPFFEGADCETSCAQTDPCFPIRVPINDPRYVNGSECIPMTRSAAACSLVSPVREQINVVTAYTDASQVYGSDMTVANKLRNNTNQLGLLAVNQNYMDNGFPFLPFSGDPNDVCTKINQTFRLPCFLAGDVRVSEQPGLTMFHTLFMREHNRVATELHELNPKWTGEKLYQESRKIIGGMMQKITFQDYLPLVLGSEMSKFLPPYTSYIEEEDPSVSNVFTIGFKLGHNQAQAYIYRLAEGYVPYHPDPLVPLNEMSFASWRVVGEGGIEPLLRGMMANNTKLNTQFKVMVDELRDRLNRKALDRVAINMQRGREHGIPGYNDWRRFCNLSAPQNVEELAIVLNNTELAEKLMKMYGTIENIDLSIGGVSEPLVPGGRMGELLSCIIGDQFRRARDGDRFFYQNPPVFSQEQRRSIEGVTLAHIICANTNITTVPENVFESNSYPEDFRNCANMPKIDLRPWEDKKKDTDAEEAPSSGE